MVGPGKGGWTVDGFDEGRTTIWINDDNKVDIISKDAGGLRSYLKGGINVTMQSVNTKDRSFLVLASGNNFAETFLVKINEAGVGTMIWTTTKNTNSFIKSSIMQADCGPRFALEPSGGEKK